MFYAVVAVIARIIAKILFRVKVYGENKKVNISDNYIVCGNHSSMLDPVLVAVTHNNQIRFMAKKELFTNFILKAFFNKLGAFPIDREGNSLTAIKKSLRILKKGEILGIFPEGTRVTDPNLSKAKGGIAVIATKTKKRILPVYIESDYSFMGKVNIYYGEFIDLKEYYDKKLSSEEYVEISNDIMEKIYSLKEDFSGN